MEKESQSNYDAILSAEMASIECVDEHDHESEGKTESIEKINSSFPLLRSKLSKEEFKIKEVKSLTNHETAINHVKSNVQNSNSFTEVSAVNFLDNDEVTNHDFSKTDKLLSIADTDSDLCHLTPKLEGCVTVINRDENSALKVMKDELFELVTDNSDSEMKYTPAQELPRNYRTLNQIKKDPESELIYDNHMTNLQNVFTAVDDLPSSRDPIVEEEMINVVLIDAESYPESVRKTRNRKTILTRDQIKEESKVDIELIDNNRTRKSISDKRHYCELCSKPFLLKTYLLRHIEDIHRRKKSFICDFCNTHYSRKNDLLNHIQIHFGEKPFACNFCGNKFFKLSNQKRHERTHSNEKPYKCQTCNLGFSYKDAVTAHMALHTGKMPFRCSVCMKEFFHRATWRSHLRKWHSHACLHCPMTFLRRRDFKNHLMIIHTGEAKWQCDACGKPFLRETSLISHLKSHLNEKFHKCKLCSKSFESENRLIAHSKNHKGQKIFRRKRFFQRLGSTTYITLSSGAMHYACFYCEERFVCKEELLSHVKYHEKTEESSSLTDYLKTHEDLSSRFKFECFQCKKKFLRKGYLHPHMRLHTGEKPYKCNMCKHSYFRLKSSLTFHMASHSIACHLCSKKCTSIANFKRHLDMHNKSFHCNFCQYKFASKHFLRLHLQEKPFTGKSGCPRTIEKLNEQTLPKYWPIDSVEGPYQCDIREKMCERKSNLERHITAHSKEKSYKCDLCMETFCKKSNFHDHLRMHSGRYAFQCKKCPKSFLYHGHLTRHNRIIHKESFEKKPFECKPCRLRFPNETDLHQHKKTHGSFKPSLHDEAKSIEKLIECDERLVTAAVPRTNVEHNAKQHRCETCNLTFRNAWDLRKHKETDTHESANETRIESEERVSVADFRRCKKTRIKHHLCTTCNLEFGRAGDLHHHIQEHNGLNSSQSGSEHFLESNTNKAIFSCTICGNIFKNKATLAGHAKTHSGILPHECRCCNKRFSRRYDMLTHLSLHTGEQPYSCQVCGKRSRIRENWKKHIMQCYKRRTLISPSIRENNYLAKDKNTSNEMMSPKTEGTPDFESTDDVKSEICI